MPGIEFDGIVPIGSLGVVSVMDTDVDQVGDVLQETATAEARSRLEGLGTGT